MPWSVKQRRAWLFPPISGVVYGIDPAYLDPNDEDDRSLLISFDHPEYEPGTEDEERMVDGEPMSPRMHLIIHAVVANQIWDGKPKDTWMTAERLTGIGYERHEVLHMIGAVVGDEIWNSLRARRLHDPEALAQGLAALPESWEAERERLAKERRHRPGRRRH